LFLGSTSPNATSTPTVDSMVFNANNGVTLGSGRRELNLELNGLSYDTSTKRTSIGGYVFLDLTGRATTIADTFSVDNIESGSW